MKTSAMIGARRTALLLLVILLSCLTSSAVAAGSGDGYTITGRVKIDDGNLVDYKDSIMSGQQLVSGLAFCLRDSEGFKEARYLCQGAASNHNNTYAECQVIVYALMHANEEHLTNVIVCNDSQSAVDFFNNPLEEASTTNLNTMMIDQDYRDLWKAANDIKTTKSYLIKFGVREINKEADFLAYMAVMHGNSAIFYTPPDYLKRHLYLSARGVGRIRKTKAPQELPPPPSTPGTAPQELLPPPSTPGHHV